MIHEAFKGFEVRFYLAVIVDGEPDVLVVFPVSYFLPGSTALLHPRHWLSFVYYTGKMDC